VHLSVLLHFDYCISLVVGTRYLERLMFKMTYYTSRGTLTTIHSLPVELEKCTIAQICRAISLQLRHVSTIEKNTC